MSRRPEAIALKELVQAVDQYREGEDEVANARLILALNAARNALQMGRVLDGIVNDPSIARGHVGGVG